MNLKKKSHFQMQGYLHSSYSTDRNININKVISTFMSKLWWQFSLTYRNTIKKNMLAEEHTPIYTCETLGCSVFQITKILTMY